MSNIERSSQAQPFAAAHVARLSLAVASLDQELPATSLLLCKPFWSRPY